MDEDGSTESLRSRDTIAAGLPRVRRAGRRAARPSAAWRALTLFQRDREVIIVHHGQEYRLRITKSDKLILTK